MFCTNGVLLRMLTSGDGLEGVTHIVVDEIHERDKFADFLLIMLRDLLPSKPNLHLVLMSATLNVALFTDYFNGCPLIQVPGYTYPVQVCLARACCNGARAAGCKVMLMCFCFKLHVQVCTAWAHCCNRFTAAVIVPWHVPLTHQACSTVDSSKRVLRSLAVWTGICCACMTR
jgi:HrpA-like RNA helicase